MLSEEPEGVKDKQIEGYESMEEKVKRSLLLKRGTDIFAEQTMEEKDSSLSLQSSSMEGNKPNKQFREFVFR